MSTVAAISGATDFNPHSHAGSDEGGFSGMVEEIDFNPHSHAGSDRPARPRMQSAIISIHTPTQGVTR